MTGFDSQLQCESEPGFFPSGSVSEGKVKAAARELSFVESPQFGIQEIARISPNSRRFLLQVSPASRLV